VARERVTKIEKRKTYLTRKAKHGSLNVGETKKKLVSGEIQFAGEETVFGAAS